MVCGVLLGGTSPLSLELPRSGGHRRNLGREDVRCHARPTPQSSSRSSSHVRAGRTPESLAHEYERSAPTIRDWVAKATESPVVDKDALLWSPAPVRTDQHDTPQAAVARGSRCRRRMSGASGMATASPDPTLTPSAVLNPCGSGKAGA